MDAEVFYPPIDIYDGDSDDEEDADQKVEAFSQIVTFIVDANCFLKDALTYDSIRRALLHKILDLGLQSKNNKVGLVFYGTENSQGHGESDQGRPETTWFMPVAPPQMHKVQELASTTFDEMRDVCGGATDTATATEALRHVCEEVLMIVRHAKGKTKAFPTFVFISAEPSPLPAGLKADEIAVWDMKAQNLRRTGAVLVAPATASKGVFPSSQQDGASGIDGMAFWTKFDRLSSHGRELADSYLGTIQRDLDKMWPVTKGLRPQRFLCKLSSKMVLPMLEIVSAKTWSHPVDGTAVPSEDIDHRGLDLSGAAKFSGVPRAYVVPRDRAAELRGGGVRGPYPCLTLLKFVPRAALTIYHQITTARFLYVDTRLPVALPDGASDQERAEAAARRAHQKAFLSLHNAMDDVAALVTVKQREDAVPRLGLLVQMEDEEAADGSQIQPPGFALHVLPYTDEVRLVAGSCPALPPAVVPKVHVSRATPAAIDAAGALIDALTDPTASRYKFNGPKELYREATLRGQVLGEDPPDRANPEFNAVRNFMAAQVIPSAVKEGFLGKVLGGQKTDPGAAAAAAGKKRAAPTMSDADIATHIDWKAEVNAGKVAKRTVDMLKAFLRHHHLPISGKKAELVQRVEEKVKSL